MTDKNEHNIVTGTDLHVSHAVLAVKVENLAEEYSTFRCSFVNGCVHVYNDDNGVQRKYIAFSGINPVDGKLFWGSTRTCPEGFYIVLLGLGSSAGPDCYVYDPETFHRLFKGTI